MENIFPFYKYEDTEDLLKLQEHNRGQLDLLVSKLILIMTNETVW